MLNSLQNKPTCEVGVWDELLVLARHRDRAVGLSRMAAAVLVAEAGYGVAVPPCSRPPPAGWQRVQPAGPVAAGLPPHLHQALHRAAGPAGAHGQPRAAALGTAAGSYARDLVDRGDSIHHPGMVEGGCGCVLSAAAWHSPPGLSAAAGVPGTGGHAGVSLARADPQVQDVSLGSAQLQPGLDAGAAGNVVLAPLNTFAGLWTSNVFLHRTELPKCSSGPGASSQPSQFLRLPEEDIMAGELMATLCCPLCQTTEEKELLSLKALTVNFIIFNLCNKSA